MPGKSDPTVCDKEIKGIGPPFGLRPAGGVDDFGERTADAKKSLHRFSFSGKVSAAKLF